MPLQSSNITFSKSNHKTYWKMVPWGFHWFITQAPLWFWTKSLPYFKQWKTRFTAIAKSLLRELTSWIFLMLLCRTVSLWVPSFTFFLFTARLRSCYWKTLHIFCKIWPIAGKLSTWNATQISIALILIAHTEMIKKTVDPLYFLRIAKNNLHLEHIKSRLAQKLVSAKHLPINKMSPFHKNPPNI